MAKDTTFGDNLASRILLFNKSGKLEEIKRKLKRRGFKIINGNSEHFLSSGPESDITGILFDPQNSHDINRLNSLKTNFPDACIICISDDKEITEKINQSNGATCYTSEDLLSTEGRKEITRRMENNTMSRYGLVLFYDPKKRFEDHTKSVVKEGISVEIAQTPEELIKKLNFHQLRANAVILDADEHSPELMKYAKNAGVKVIAVVSPEDLKNGEIRKSVDYVIMKKKRQKFASAELIFNLEKCINSQARITEPIKISPLEKKTLVGKLVYVMGTSVAGKTTLCQHYTQLKPDSGRFGPKHSTRPPRDGEAPTEITHVTDEEFDDILAREKFLDSYSKRGFRYGLHKVIVEYLKANKNVLTTGTGFEELTRLPEKLREELKEEAMMCILLFADKTTLEDRLKNMIKTEQETPDDLKRTISSIDTARKRISGIKSETQSLDSHLKVFKYLFFSHYAQDMDWNANRLDVALSWEHANPGLSYEETHERYVDRILRIITNKKLSELKKNNIRISVSDEDIGEFCSHPLRQELEESLRTTFPLKVKYINEPNHGRLALYIDDKKRLGPTARKIIVDLFEHVLAKKGFTPKAKVQRGSYRKRSLFGLVRAEGGELCDGISYSLTDECKLHPQDHSPFMISFGFFKRCSDDYEISALSTEEAVKLADDLPGDQVIHHEFKHAVEKYKKD